MTRRISILGLLLTIAATAVASPAYGQANVQQDGYSNVAGQVQEQVAGVVGGSGEGDGGGDAGGALPFTGLDLGFLGIGSVGLIAVGVGLRRLTRAPQPS